MAWSARIEGHEWRLYQGDRLVFCVDGLPSEALVDVSTIVNALNAYGPSDVLMREIAALELPNGELVHRVVDRWATAAKMIMSTRSEIRSVTTVEIGNVPASGVDE